MNIKICVIKTFVFSVIPCKNYTLNINNDIWVKFWRNKPCFLEPPESPKEGSTFSLSLDKRRETDFLDGVDFVCVLSSSSDSSPAKGSFTSYAIKKQFYYLIVNYIDFLILGKKLCFQYYFINTGVYKNIYLVKFVSSIRFSFSLKKKFKWFIKFWEFGISYTSGINLE